MVTSPQTEAPSVLQQKLGEDGAVALTEMMQTFWQTHLWDLEDAAWRRTEERLDRIEGAIERLTLAQGHTEEQADQLAKAQQRTEAQISKLVGAIDTLCREVGYLERHLQIRMLGPLGEELQPMVVGPEGRELEIDLAGNGVREGQTQMVVCEVKSRIYSDDVFRFQDRIEQMRAYLPERIVPVLFGHRIHPTAQEAAEPLGILLVGSYQR